MGKRLSLADCLPLSERVGIGGGREIDVHGVSGEDIGKILGRFPDAFSQLVNAGLKPGGINPALLGAIIAATQRNGKEESMLGNDEVEARGRGMGIGAQMKVLKAMGRCTFPDGIGPFLEDLESASKAAREATEVVVRVGSRVKDTASPKPPKPSDAPDIPPSGS